MLELSEKQTNKKAHRDEDHCSKETGDQSRVNGEHHLRSRYDLCCHNLCTTHNSADLRIGPVFQLVNISDRLEGVGTYCLIPLRDL